MLKRIYNKLPVGKKKIRFHPLLEYSKCYLVKPENQQNTTVLNRIAKKGIFAFTFRDRPKWFQPAYENTPTL